MRQNEVLYFPSIEFQSETWVKSSLLLWDAIYRIVPQDYKPNDCSEIRLAQENNLIRNITLEKKDIIQAGDEFRQFYDNLHFIPAGLESEQTELVHIDKIDSRLYPFLDGVVRKSYGKWVRFPKELARGYMFYLSRVVSDRRNIARATDDRDSWTVAPFITEDANFGEYIYDCNAEGFYSSLIVSDAIPHKISDVSMQEIIRFVTHRQEQREVFRKTITEFANDLSACDSAEFARQKIDGYQQKLEKAKKDFRKSMDFLNDDGRSSLFTMGIPVSLTAFGAFAVDGDPFNICKLFGSVLAGAVAAYKDFTRVRTQKRKNSHLAYLIDIDDELINKHAYPDFPYLFDQFIND